MKFSWAVEEHSVSAPFYDMCRKVVANDGLQLLQEGMTIHFERVECHGYGYELGGNIELVVGERKIVGGCLHQVDEPGKYRVVDRDWRR